MSTVTEKSIQECECRRCRHVWLPRTKSKPKACPRCKHYDWEKEVKNAKAQLRYVRKLIKRNVK